MTNRSNISSGLPDDAATDYARKVVSGEIMAGPHVRAAGARHLRDLTEGSSRGLAWDVAEVRRAIGFFWSVLTVSIEEPNRITGEIDSRTVPFKLEPWQAFIVGSLFGWYRDGVRRFRRAYVEVAKGNGKSPLAAGIGHYMLTSFEPKKDSIEVYSAATDRDQAEILFRDAVSMWERSHALRRRLRESGDKRVTQLQTFKKPPNFFKPISSDKKGKSGIRPYCALIDEVHEHPNNSVIEMIRAGTKGNQEALIFEITNSGFDKKSVCGQEHDYAVSVVSGLQDNDSWFSFVTSLDEDDEPFEDETCWIKANPNLGVSIRLPFIREQVEEARGMPSKEGLVRRLHFCQWTESENTAIPRAIWTACEATEDDPFDADDLTARNIRCYGGLDLSRTRDLTAFSLTWLIDDSRDRWEFASKTWFWTPRDTLRDRAKRDRAPYEVWVEQGHLEAVPGPRIRYSWMADALLRLCAKYHPVQIGGDQYGLEQLLEALDDAGESLPIVVHPQGFNRRVVGKREDERPEDSGADQITLWMPDSINKLEAALLERRILLDINPVMRMCASGAVYEQNRTGHRMFAKDKATTRIDGMVSLAMSIGVATLQTPPPSIATRLHHAILERGGFA